MVKKIVKNKTTFTQKIEGNYTRGLCWSCKKNSFDIEIVRSNFSWYIFAKRKKDEKLWNSLWTKTRWNDLDEAMEFASKFDYEKLNPQL